MHPDDVVDPADAALNDLLTTMLDHTDDEARRTKLLVHLMTISPLREWPANHLAQLSATCAYVISLSRMSRELQSLE